MLRLLGLEASFASICFWVMPAAAQLQAPPRSEPPKADIVVLTGDSWRDSEKIYRLYGVQSCLRGALYTDRTGSQQDCGAVSAAMLSAFLRDTRPQCRPVAQIAVRSTAPTTLVVCSVHIGSQTLDLGSTLIGQGFAFAAVTDSGAPVYLPYLAQEMLAHQDGRGLWAFRGFQRPDLSHTGSR